MTATTYHLYRLLLATKLPIKTRRFLKQASQEGRFLNQLHIRLGRKNWACLASVSDLKTEYRVLERLNQSRADLQKRIADLKEQLARADKPAPVMQQEDAPEPIRRSDALTGEIRYRKASILKRQREMERIGKALGKEDPIYQEIERELELMRQHLHHLQVKLASFDQREAETRTDNTALLAAVARQKLTVALQSLKLNDQQLNTLMEPFLLRAGLYLAQHPALMEENGKLRGRNKPLLALIRAVNRSHERLCRITVR